MPSWMHAWSRTRTRGCGTNSHVLTLLVPSPLLPRRAGLRSSGTCTEWLAASVQRAAQVDTVSTGAWQVSPIDASQVGCESATKTGMVMVFGEITTSAKVDYEAIVRKTCRDIGFTSAEVGLDADKCKVPSVSMLLLMQGQHEQ